MVNELNVDQSTLVRNDLEYGVGDWLALTGDYIVAVEYNPKQRKEISKTNFGPSNNPGPIELISSFGGKWLVRTEEGRYYQIGNRDLRAPGNFKSLSNDTNETKEAGLKDIDMPIKDKGVFSQVDLEGDNEGTSDLDKYRDQVQHTNGSDYRSDKPVSPGYLDEEVIDEGIRDLIKKGVITVAMALSFLGVNAQETNDEKLLNALEQSTGVRWELDTAKQLFVWEPDAKPEAVGDIPKLNLGDYPKIKAAHQVKQNRNVNGTYHYTVEVDNTSYLESGLIFQNIKKYNPELKGSEVEFIARGKPVRTIKL